MRQPNKWIVFSIGLLLINLGLFTYLLQLGPPLPYYRNETQVGMPVQPIQISEATLVYINEIHDLCNEANLSCQKPIMLTGIDREKLNGLGLDELAVQYSTKDNWQIETDNLAKSIILKHRQEGLCQLHQDYYHFTEKSGLVVIYRGPAAIGQKAGVILNTELAMDDLPQEYADKIRAGQWETRNWDELQAIIDTLDE